jgi:hypothetical protein
MHWHYRSRCAAALKDFCVHRISYVSFFLGFSISREIVGAQDLAPLLRGLLSENSCNVNPKIPLTQYTCASAGAWFPYQHETFVHDLVAPTQKSN